MACKSQSQRWASFLYTSKVRTTPTQWQLAPAQLWDALGVRHVRHVRHCHGMSVHIWHASSTMLHKHHVVCSTEPGTHVRSGQNPRWKWQHVLATYLETEWKRIKRMENIETSTDRVKMFYVVDSHALDSKPMELPACCTFWYFLDVLRSAAGAQPGGWLRRRGAAV